MLLSLTPHHLRMSHVWRLAVCHDWGFLVMSRSCTGGITQETQFAGFLPSFKWFFDGITPFAVSQV